MPEKKVLIGKLFTFVVILLRSYNYFSVMLIFQFSVLTLIVLMWRIG